MDDPAGTIDAAGEPLEQWFAKLDALLARRRDIEDDRAALLATIDAAIKIINLRLGEISERMAELRAKYPGTEECAR